MTSQQQELSIYKDHSITQVQGKALTVITHVQGTLPTWLIAGLLESYLLDTCSIINSTSQLNNYTITKPRSKVIIFSFSQDYTTYEKYFKKVNVTLQNSNLKVINLLPLIVAGDEDAILQKIKTETNSPVPLNVFIESPETLVHLTDIDIDKYLAFLHTIHRNNCNNITMILNINDAMINLTNQNHLQQRHLELCTKLLHKSNLIINLKPLQTGRADDVTGIMTISNGLMRNDNITEKEYLYLINKEGSVKLFYR